MHTNVKTFIYILGIYFFSFFLSENIFAQSIQLSGKVSERINHQPLAGANIFLENSHKGTVTDKSGSFNLIIPEPGVNLVISYLGFKTIIISPSEYKNTQNLEITLEEDLIPFSEGAVIVGSRFGSRSSLSSPVPIEQFTSAVLDQTGQSDLSQQINSLAPSFYSTRLTYSDATDHMDPAALRGMNPDQTLILVNGKRHHPSAIVNTLGVVGRGSLINDLNTIPASAIQKVEILHDGASAQYGSDAIAGVINIVLKENTGKLSLKSHVGQCYEGDGLQTNFSANYGFRLAKKGFVNITSEFRRRELTNRAGIYEGLVYRTEDQDDLSYEDNVILDNQLIASNGLTREDFKMQLGNSAMSDGNIYINANLPVFKTFELYAFGGTNIRNSKSAGDFRLPNQALRRNLVQYPNGFLPEIEARLNDQFLSTGIKGSILQWDSDLSYTYGRNTIGFFVNNSTNASMEEGSPTNFKSGNILYSQNILNLDLSRDFGSKLNMELFRLSFGSEFRSENYQIRAGEENSWINENQLSYPGAQGYPGYQPSDETDAERNNLAFYGDLSFKPLKALLLNVAGRFENYSDFGSNLSGKISSICNIADWLNVRGSFSTGFRAPSLHQSYYNYTGSYYSGGYLYEILTARNSNPVTASFGIPELKEETSNSYSFGITSKPEKNTSLSLDFYQIDVQNRIVLSGTFYHYDGNDVIDSLLADFPTTGGVQFFTNAVDTRTQGIDFVLSHEIPYSKGLFGAGFGLNVSKTKIIGELHSSEAIIENGLTEQLFDRQSRALLELAQPSLKFNITLNYVLNKLSCVLRTTHYGEVSYLGAYDTAEDQIYSSKWITDIKLSYKISRIVSVSAGANNLFNVYPDVNNPTLQSQGRFIYNTAVTQFGFNGGYYYAGLQLEF
jgi:iron complex outermembrane receptor protein